MHIRVHINVLIQLYTHYMYIYIHIHTIRKTYIKGATSYMQIRTYSFVNLLLQRTTDPSGSIVIDIQIFLPVQHSPLNIDCTSSSLLIVWAKSTLKMSPDNMHHFTKTYVLHNFSCTLFLSYHIVFELSHCCMTS